MTAGFIVGGPISGADAFAPAFQGDRCLERALQRDHFEARLAAHRALCNLLWCEQLAAMSFEDMKEQPFGRLCASYVHLLAEHQRIAAAGRVPADPRD